MGKASKRKASKRTGEQSLRRSPQELLALMELGEAMGWTEEEYKKEQLLIPVEQLDLVTDILNKQGFSGFSLSQDFVKEWGLTNFLTELEKLNKINLQSGTFMFARKELFNSLCWILIDENEYIDKFSFKDYRELYDRGENLIKTAGELIYKNHGEAGMRDPMIWQFIPKSCSRFVDNAFNGIGGWLS